jgi:acyl carrier protein
MKVDSNDLVKLMKECGIEFDENRVGNDAILQESGLDSLDMANLFLAIEETYSISVPDESAPSLVSVNAICEFLNANL